MADVAIIGAGPVGLSAALALARLGVDVEVFEANAEPNDMPKASTIHPPTLEILSEWNVLGDAFNRGLRVHRVQYRDLRSDRTFVELDYSQLADVAPYPYRLQIAQPHLERILLDHVRRLKPTAVHYGAAVSAIESREEHVALTLRIADLTEMVFAQYVLAADGAASLARKLLGINLAGKGEEQRYMLVGTDLELSKYRPDITDVAYLCDPEDPCVAMKVPGCLHTVFPLHEYETEKDALHVGSVGRRLGLIARAEIDRVEIHHYAVYSVARRVAEKFRADRVFLLGDAAHLEGPAEAAGLGAGIADAHEIAWRIAGALGGAGEGSLEGYERRRRRAALLALERDGESSLLRAGTLDEQRARDDYFEHVAASRREARQLLLRSSMLA